MFCLCCCASQASTLVHAMPLVSSEHSKAEATEEVVLSKKEAAVTQDNLEVPLTPDCLNDLSELVAPFFGPRDWMVAGILLHIPITTLEEIHGKNQTNKENFTEVLLTWLQQPQDLPLKAITKGQFIFAIHTSGTYKIAICEILKAMGYDDPEKELKNQRRKFLSLYTDKKDPCGASKATMEDNVQDIKFLPFIYFVFQQAKLNPPLRTLITNAVINTGTGLALDNALSSTYARNNKAVFIVALKHLIHDGISQNPLTWSQLRDVLYGTANRYGTFKANLVTFVTKELNNTASND